MSTKTLVDRSQQLRIRASRAARYQPTLWRYGFNLWPTMNFRRNPPALTETQRQLVETMTRDGVVSFACHQIAGLADLVDQQRRETDELLADWATRPEQSGHAEEKSYLDELYGYRPRLDPSCSLARLAAALAPLAMAYMRMDVQVRYYNVWWNHPSDGAAKNSQLWHRDREDFHVVKAFVYLSDVGALNGPFRYVLGSQPEGRPTTEPAGTYESGIWRGRDEEVERAVGAHRMVDMLGAAGTVVLADTRGLHAGGKVVERDRLLATIMFTSKTSQTREQFGERPLQVPALFARG